MKHQWVAVILGAAGLAAGAHAQNALGDGRGMQKNTNKYDTSLGPENKGFDIQAARMRDAIVFGRAPGGLTTRVSSLPDSSQFMGVLGTDSLYNFRRDSYFSGLAGQGIRSTDALQYQFAMTTGGAVRKPGLLEGSLAIGRYGTTGATVTENPAVGRALTKDYASEWRTDNLQSTGGALRATSSFVTSSMLKPSIVGERVDENGNYRTVAASPMLGLQTLSREVSSPLNVPVNAPAKTGAADAAADPRSAAPGSPNDRADASTTSGKISTTSYDEAAQRLKAAGKSMNQEGDKADEAKDQFKDENGQPTNMPKWMRDIEKLKNNLNEQREKSAAVSKLTKAPGTEVTKIPPGMPKPPPGMTYNDAGKLVPLVDESVLGVIRESGTTGARFVKPIPNDRDPFFTEMASGERYFQKSQFFLAEEKFARALSLRPGDTSALTARVHAQLAGGMYQSAASNLRDLLTTNPEIATIRYARDLLPNEERAKLLEEDLDNRMSLNPRMLGTTGLKSLRDAGLLRAYLGYQLGDSKAVDRGLQMMLTTFDGRSEPTLNEQALAVFLRGVWMPTRDGGTPAPAAAPARVEEKAPAAKPQ
ncbi:MAG: hypothetical protein U0573_02610 [Phycisphaerales bacterium]|nr:hypothetical protein [Planctomycetota bacterium]